MKRIAIINRGEPAMRLIRAVAELNQAQGKQIHTIAFYTEPDRLSMFVREADESYLLGPATFLDSRDGQRKSSYLDYARLRQGLTECQAHAAWVGWGFVAEHDAFADLCDELGVTFIGPSGAVMRMLGDKIASKQLAEKCGVPVAPWSGEAIKDLDELRVVADRLGYPFLIKASAGGGGRGIRRVESAADLAEGFERARGEALKAFGDDRVFAEKMVAMAHHIEVQIVADHQGTCWALGVRDCTVQRRHQKVIEEAPAPHLTPAEELALREAGRRLALAAGYTNVGTVEFLCDPDHRFFFMEMNTRLQVEHPVTELTTGVDLVKMQLHLAFGGKLEGEPPPTQGHAVEVRLNAEDPDHGFAPAPGRVSRFRLPAGPGLRIDTGITDGDTIPTDFDSMVAKIIAYGRDRPEALARLRRGLVDCLLVIDGGTNNKAFLLELLGHPDFTASRVDIGWLDRLMQQDSKPMRPFANVALVRAAIECARESLQVEQAQFLTSFARGRPKVRQAIGLPVELRYLGQPYKLTVYRTGINSFRINVEDILIRGSLDQRDQYDGWLTLGNERYRVVVHPQGLNYLVEVNGVLHAILRDDDTVVRAPAPSIVVALAVEEGQTVEGGDKLVVLEAMKTEMAVTAPGPARIGKIMVRAGQQVDAAAPLIMLEPLETGEAATSNAARINFKYDWSQTDAPTLPAAQGEDYQRILVRRYREHLKALRPFLHGFDVTRTEVRALTRELTSLRDELTPEDVETTRLEETFFRFFVDLLHLYDSQAGESISGSEQLLAYFRAIEEEGSGLPESFRTRLERLLQHYGVTSLVPSPELRDALLLSYQAYSRTNTIAGLLHHLLARLLGGDGATRAPASEQFKGMLEELSQVTQERFPTIHDITRQVIYRCYHQRLLERERERVYQSLDARIHQLFKNPEQEEGHLDQVEYLVDSPQPLVGLAARWFKESTPAMRRTLAEIILRRFYRIRDLRDLHTEDLQGMALVSGDFTFDNRKTLVVASLGDLGRLPESVAACLAQVDARQDCVETMLEFFVFVDPAQARSISPLDLFARFDLPQTVSRISLVLADPGKARALEYFTLALAPEGGYREIAQYRGIHPMWAGRLELWRLRDFEYQRMQTDEDIYIFHATAKTNSRDRRLVAFVDVRDLTPVSEEEGAGIRLPFFEALFYETMAALRDIQDSHPQERLAWNRASFYLWPPLPISREQLIQVVKTLAPATRNRGLQKIIVRARVPGRWGGITEEALHFSLADGQVVQLRLVPPTEQPIHPLSAYDQKVLQARARGMFYPYEIIRMLTPDAPGSAVLFPQGRFVEYDLDQQGALTPVERPHGQNTANVVLGVIRNFTPKMPEGMTRVVILGDPTREMGALAEPECRRIIAAIDLAEQLGVPLEWFPLSAGAKIALDSGTENLDWTARVLRRLIEFTQARGEVNIVIDGINVGAQSYWNAEATMLMHTRGILIMTTRGSMLLTGKKALDYSGSVSAPDSLGIGGVERIMGPNGQAQYFATDLTQACLILYQHYEFSYRFPGEAFPRRTETTDARDRDITLAPYLSSGEGLSTVGDIFSPTANPFRKIPFDIRSVMRAIIDQDKPFLERWPLMRDAEMAVVWDAFLGGIPLALVGFESKNLPRVGFVPGDGPTSWNGGTLFPRASQKVARAINSASGNRPLALIANLSGFDGSPESMLKRQLEFGAEIGRAMVNFDGPLILCVIARYHGGAYVVFSRALNENIQALALEGSFASVIGGAPAAAVVLTSEVKKRTYADARVRMIKETLEQASPAEKPKLLGEWNALLKMVEMEMQVKVAEEFDRIHSVQRAKEVGSLDAIIPVARLRPLLIEALERGMARTVR